MDLSQVKARSLSSDETEEKPADPFASDVFADPRSKESLPSPIPREEKEKPTWVLRIPKVSRPTVDWNDLLRKLPADLSQDLPDALAASLFRDLSLKGENLLLFLPIVTSEANNGILDDARNSCWLSVGVENSSAEFAVEIDGAFGAWLIDKALGEDISDGASLRELTPTEIAVLEFLAIDLTSEANSILHAPLFKFRSASREVPAWIDQRGANFDPLLVSTWQTVYESRQGVIKLYLTPQVLRALQSSENKLLTAAPRQEVIWRSLQSRINDVRARMYIGETQATLGEVAGLEIGDVALLENYSFSLGAGGLFGSAEIFLGDGGQVKISGAFASDGNESPDEFEMPLADADNKAIVRRIRSNNALRFSIEYIEGLEDPQVLEEFMQEETENTIEQATESVEEQQGIGVPIENLSVTLRVELEGRRLSLAEVANLRVDQTIELGARPTDPVNLMIDNKVVARGELVEVEDRLGVRIIQILR